MPTKPIVGVWRTQTGLPPQRGISQIAPKTVSKSDLKQSAPPRKAINIARQPKQSKHSERIAAYLQSIEKNSNPKQSSRTIKTNNVRHLNKNIKLNNSSKSAQDERARAVIIDQIMVESLAAGVILTLLDGVNQVVNCGKYSLLGVQYFIGDTVSVGKRALNVFSGTPKS